MAASSFIAAGLANAVARRRFADRMVPRCRRRAQAPGPHRGPR
ncbi:hypothetical protein V1227_23465 [Lentzea sp. DG1S-22]|nr:hypothetical protein [Lentzea sp. DG1S-22]WVH78048.1 hypothetical protein V1227_23465 [Lentzea sp. DG1S-22]